MEEWIIQEIARRISSSIGHVVTQSALHQYYRAEAWGFSLDWIQAEVARITGKGEAEIAILFDDAMRESVKYDDAIYRDAGLTPPDLESSGMKEWIVLQKERTKGQMRNFTQSMGFAVKSAGSVRFLPVARFYQDTLDFALTQVHSGAADYVTAIRGAVSKMAGSGLRVVDYATGHQNRIDVAARRAVLSGVKDTARELSRKRGEGLGITIWEISAHSGARPTHQVWQGKRFDTTGKCYPTKEQLTHGQLEDYG